MSKFEKVFWVAITCMFFTLFIMFATTAKIVPREITVEPSTANITVKAISPAPSIIVEPAEVTLVMQDEYVSAFQGKEYLIRDMVIRAIYNSDYRTWLRDDITIEYTGDAIWAIRVKYTNGIVEYFTFNEKWGWID